VGRASLRFHCRLDSGALLGFALGWNFSAASTACSKRAQLSGSASGVSGGASGMVFQRSQLADYTDESCREYWAQLGRFIP
jgi:hypothetical protein